MASPHLAEDDDDSDYGSDFTPEEQELADRLLAVVTLDDIQDIEDTGKSHRKTRQHASKACLPKSSHLRSDKKWVSPALSDEDDSKDLGFATKITEPNIDSQQKDTSRARGTRKEYEVDPDFIESLVKANELESKNNRSPLERFRNAKNKRALSVTDLISTSWCELQYFYQMRTGKKKRRTPAMKQGTKIHAALEEQVSTPVIVTTTTRQDEWGLRFWNVIQGLKTLRETGITRELEVWGTIGGVTVNGVIDELSYICPDNDMEYDLQLQRADELYSPDRYREKTISEFFRPQLFQAFSSGTQNSKSFDMNSRDTRKVYITDVKTRNSNSLPSDTAFRPTKMQLMLYHHLLLKLSTGKVDFAQVASSYDLDLNSTFSDSFIVEMASIQDSPSTNPDDDNYILNPPSDNGKDALTILLAHNNLSLLWDLMISEFQKTFPNGRQSLGNVLQAEYRAPSLVSEGGRVLGSKTFPMSEHVLDIYIDYEMRFWRGERPPVGVMMGEAWKCGYCDFAAACEWRKEREKEILLLAKKVSVGGGKNTYAARKTQRVEVEEEAETMEGVELSDDTSPVESPRTLKTVNALGNLFPTKSNRNDDKHPQSREPSQDKSSLRSYDPALEQLDIESTNLGVEPNVEVVRVEPNIPPTPKRGRGRPKKISTDTETKTPQKEAKAMGSLKKKKQVGKSAGSEGTSDSEWQVIQNELMIAEAEADADADGEEEELRPIRKGRGRPKKG